MIKKITILVVSLVFIFFGYLQSNDPDALLWIFIYCLPAIISILYLLNYSNVKFAYIGIFYIFYAVYIYIYNFETNVMHIFDEKTNESLGLIITGIWIIYFSLKKK